MTSTHYFWTEFRRKWREIDISFSKSWNNFLLWEGMGIEDCHFSLTLIPSQNFFPEEDEKRTRTKKEESLASFLGKKWRKLIPMNYDLFILSNFYIFYLSPRPEAQTEEKWNFRSTEFGFISVSLPIFHLTKSAYVPRTLHKLNNGSIHTIFRNKKHT